ncbi:spore coat protein U domain-containing protein [Acidovorax sp. JHL-9]|uniref:spore coat protein U domain-containing protein n=1 Tax=Acidovorax sp. JHL-9 TaxID=1276756 RepID=UPI00041CB771|nr:spore coat protein U domain-containing protein [Acidovorax sp. JHL-9]
MTKFTQTTLVRTSVAAGLILGAGAAQAATATGTMDASATLTNSCTVSASTLTFASTAALASSADVTANTGTSLQVACTTGTAPKLYSATPRTLVNGTDSFAFNLSLTSGAAADDLPTAAPVSSNIAAPNGSDQTVTVYGKILASNFGSMPAGSYTRAVTLSVDY